MTPSSLPSMAAEKHKSDNVKAKRAVFTKRVPTLKKKAMELSVLCDVSVCLICFGPDGDLHLWPENPNEVRQLATRYRALKEQDRKKRCVDLKGFLATETIKADNNMKKKAAKKPNLESLGERDPDWDERIDGFSDEELRALVSELDSKLFELTARMDNMMNSKEAGRSERTNNDLPGVTLDNVDLLECIGQNEETWVHRIEGAHNDDNNLAVDDIFGELGHLSDNFEVPVGESEVDKGFLGFDANHDAINAGYYDFSMENGFGDVYNYGFMEIEANYTAEIEQTQEPLLLQFPSY